MSAPADARNAAPVTSGGPTELLAARQAVAAMKDLTSRTLWGFSSPEDATAAVGEAHEVARLLRTALRDVRVWLQAEHTGGRLALSPAVADPDADDLTVFVRVTHTTQALSLALSAADLLVDALDRTWVAGTCLTAAAADEALADDDTAHDGPTPRPEVTGRE
jgi:hypothetical protein